MLTAYRYACAELAFLFIRLEDLSGISTSYGII